MPIYEYRCNDCQSKVSLYIRNLSDTPQPVCNKCNSRNLNRLFSTFARIKTDKDVYEEILNDNDLTKGMMANDPRAMLEWSRRLEGTESEKTPEYEEAIQKMERGEPLENIAAEMKQNQEASESGSPSGLEE